MANDITTEDQEMGGAKQAQQERHLSSILGLDVPTTRPFRNFREVMQGPAIIKMLADVREDPTPVTPKSQQEMLSERHEVFLSTPSRTGSIAVPWHRPWHGGEQGRGNDETSSGVHQLIKTALMGPFAGIGDCSLPGTPIPILLSIAPGMSPNGEVTGPSSTSWSSWPSCCRSPGSSSPPTA